MIKADKLTDELKTELIVRVLIVSIGHFIKYGSLLNVVQRTAYVQDLVNKNQLSPSNFELSTLTQSANEIAETIIADSGLLRPIENAYLRGNQKNKDEVNEYLFEIVENSLLEKGMIKELTREPSNELHYLITGIKKQVNSTDIEKSETTSMEARLKELKQLYKQGLITKKVFEQKQQSIIAEL